MEEAPITPDVMSVGFQVQPGTVDGAKGPELPATGLREASQRFLERWKADMGFYFKTNVVGSTTVGIGAYEATGSLLAAIASAVGTNAGLSVLRYRLGQRDRMRRQDVQPGPIAPPIPHE